MAVVSTNIQHARYDPALPATTGVFAECAHRIKVPDASQRAAGVGSVGGASQHGVTTSPI